MSTVTAATNQEATEDRLLTPGDDLVERPLQVLKGLWRKRHLLEPSKNRVGHLAPHRYLPAHRASPVRPRPRHGREHSRDQAAKCPGRDFEPAHPTIWFEIAQHDEAEAQVDAHRQRQEEQVEQSPRSSQRHSNTPGGVATELRI